MYNDWRDEHRIVIDSFLEFLNKKSEEFILKGGTALLTCYNLDRFSEDIDLDSKSKRNIEKIIEDFCKKNGYTYTIPKNTDTTKRFMIQYNNELKKLKVEVSYRRNNIKETEYTKINNILVYNINELCLMKSMAYTGRDKIRDLYDICFICNNYWNKLSDDVKNSLRVAFEYKGLEQFEFVVKDQKDELINNEKLANDFIKVFDKLGLLSDIEAKDKFEQNNAESDEDEEDDEI